MMEKYAMREWVAALEGMIDNKLKKWKKEPKIENGEAVHLSWLFEQTHIQLVIFWEDHRETVTLKCISPRSAHEYLWHGLSDQTFNRVADRVGNLSQIVMTPPLDSAYWDKF